MLEKRLKEIKDRKVEIRNLLENGQEVDLETIKVELDQLEKEERSIGVKLEMAKTLGDKEERKIEKPGSKEEKKMEERNFAVMKREELLRSEEYRSAFFKSLRGLKLDDVEKKAFEAETEQRALSTASGSAGPAIPLTTLDLIMQRLYQTSVLLPKIRVTYVPGNLAVVVQSALVDADWHGEGAAATGKDEVVARVQFSGFELIRLVQISRAALAMTVEAFETFIVDEIVRRLSVAIENAILNGTGSTNGQPAGILNDITWGDSNSTTFTKAGMTYEDVLKFFSLLPTLYHKNACICMSRQLFFNELINVTDNYGRPIFVYNPENPLSYKVLGYDVIIDDYMPADTMLLCDHNYYQMNFQQGVQVEKSYESSFGKNLVDYKATAILDGHVLIPEAFVKATRATA